MMRRRTGDFMSMLPFQEELEYKHMEEYSEFCDVCTPIAPSLAYPSW